jgi:hypothetical protein
MNARIPSLEKARSVSAHVPAQCALSERRLQSSGGAHPPNPKNRGQPRVCLIR